MYMRLHGRKSKWLCKLRQLQGHKSWRLAKLLNLFSHKFVSKSRYVWYGLSVCSCVMTPRLVHFTWLVYYSFYRGEGWGGRLKAYTCVFHKLWGFSSTLISLHLGEILQFTKHIVILITALTVLWILFDCSNGQRLPLCMNKGSTMTRLHLFTFAERIGEKNFKLSKSLSFFFHSYWHNTYMQCIPTYWPWAV